MDIDIQQVGENEVSMSVVDHGADRQCRFNMKVDEGQQSAHTQVFDAGGCRELLDDIGDDMQHQF